MSNISIKSKATGFQKFLRAAIKLEETQVMRRMRDIEDIQNFDEQKEAQKTRRFHQQTTLDRHAKKYAVNRFAHPEYVDGEWQQAKGQELNDLLELEHLSVAAKRMASAGELEQLAELQRVREQGELLELQELEAFQQLCAEEHHDFEFKQLPAASEEIFTGKFSDVIEAEMQREIKDNCRALKEFEPPHLDLTPQKETVPATIASAEEESSLMLVSDDGLQQLEQERTAESTEENSSSQPKRKTESVFYFRSTPNLPKE